MKITHKFIVRKSAISIPTPAEISEEIRSRAMLAAQRVLWQSDGVISVIVFLFGLAIGSFLNVCICRLPHGESIVTPPSHCPQCGRHIRIWDNIPVLSYVLLRGRCRNCHARISPLYPAVELLTAMLFVGCYRTFGLTPAFAKWTVFCAILLVLIFTDLRDRILPDSVNFTGFAIGLGASLFVPLRENTSLWISNRLFDFPPPNPVLSLMNALIGAACGGGLLWIFGEGYFLLRHREGMGLGDAKMMLVAGAFLGWQNALLTILAASVMGSVIGIAFLAAGRKGRDYEWPFGTFLGISAILVAFWGQPVITWYLSLF